jgi:hypothetical protein
MPKLYNNSYSVFLAVDLVKGFLCGMVEFKLKDVDIIIHLYDQVGPASGGVGFHLDILPHQGEHQVDHDLEIPLNKLFLFVVSPG